MEATELSVAMILCSLTVISVLGNFFLLHHYMFIYLTRYRFKFTDGILMHLVVANILTALSKGIPQTMAALGLNDFLNDVGCKLTGALHRISRGGSIGSTCFLSVFQAIIINPRYSRHPELKINSHKNVCYSLYLNWLINLHISTVNIMYMRGKSRNESTENLKSYLYCYSVRHDQTSDILYGMLLSVLDILFLGLMLWASGSMVVTLYRHKRRMLQMPRSNISSSSSHESRATTTILLLVSTFVSFYTISFLSQFLAAVMYNPSWYLLNGTAMASLFFPTACPFLLMSRDSRVSSYLLTLKMRKHFPKASNQELN